ncbi:glutathione S-transferase [Maribrevibacterium harenarium]|uniref:glutathione transferase n=1 Tax=Maribrevibacterium harenarium TaxID=2589817 RepID=A0A501WGM7_9GAMM|nr:glutathione S-transferase [Maribrevibacterium harenarium]TPE47510.1 glutathione S-transferase [Maribrevibacterium harenarium]
MITLHHLENSRSQRIAWALEALELDYQIRHYQRVPETNEAPEELKAIHPLGKAPVLEDDGVIIAESAAILEYLVERYGHNSTLKPLSDVDLRDYRYWLHFAEGSLMPLLVMQLLFDKIPTQPMPFFVRPIAKGIGNAVKAGFIQPRLAPMVALMEQHLAKQPWFAGQHFTIADIQMSFPLLAMEQGKTLAKSPHIQAWLERVREQPSYQKAVAKVGEYRAF